MTNSIDDIRSAVEELADIKLKTIAEDIAKDLQQYARKHRRTGELARNIVMRRKGKKHAFIIDGGARENFSDRTYHPIHFFIHDEGKQKLTQVLQDARRKIK